MNHPSPSKLSDYTPPEFKFIPEYQPLKTKFKSLPPYGMGYLKDYFDLTPSIYEFMLTNSSDRETKAYLFGRPAMSHDGDAVNPEHVSITVKKNGQETDATEFLERITTSPLFNSFCSLRAKKSEQFKKLLWYKYTAGGTRVATPLSFDSAFISPDTTMVSSEQCITVIDGFTWIETTLLPLTSVTLILEQKK